MFQRVCIGALGIVFLIAGLHRAGRLGAIVYGGFIFLAAGAASWVAGATYGFSRSRRARYPPVARRSTRCCRCFRCTMSSAG